MGQNYQDARKATLDNPEERRRQSWNDMLQMASLGALSRGADASTMLGFALGKWLSGYLGRGQDKAEAKKAADLRNQLMHDQTQQYAYSQGLLDSNKTNPVSVAPNNTNPVIDATGTIVTDAGKTLSDNPFDQYKYLPKSYGGM